MRAESFDGQWGRGRSKSTSSSALNRWPCASRNFSSPAQAMRSPTAVSSSEPLRQPGQNIVFAFEGIEPSTRRLRVGSSAFSRSRELPNELAGSACLTAAPAAFDDGRKSTAKNRTRPQRTESVTSPSRPRPTKKERHAERQMDRLSPVWRRPTLRYAATVPARLLAFDRTRRRVVGGNMDQKLTSPCASRRRPAVSDAARATIGSGASSRQVTGVSI